jgi:hypothetical protein
MFSTRSHRFFESSHFVMKGTSDLKLHGSDGRTLEGYFESKDGPAAYLGTSVPGFPNFFLLMGYAICGAFDSCG